MRDENKKPWFRVKRLGYGVGLPIAWEGWLVLLLYVTVVVLSSLLLSVLTFGTVFLLSTAALVYIAYVRSDDEWRWRSE